jgi:hypothetical protein
MRSLKVASLLSAEATAFADADLPSNPSSRLWKLCEFLECSPDSAGAPLHTRDRRYRFGVRGQRIEIEDPDPRAPAVVRAPRSLYHPAYLFSEHRS